MTSQKQVVLFNLENNRSDENDKHRRRAERQFWLAHSRGKWRARLGRLAKNEDRLLDLAETLKNVRVNARHYLGRQCIPIDQIRGSEGRSHDFDDEFNPLALHTMDRWIDIAKAQYLGLALPPIDLIKLGEVYFVRDGHHRISVAHDNGQKEIDAEVIVWEL